MKHEITHSEKTVWINSFSGECIARFDKFAGIDIHNTYENHENTGKQCLYCTHEKPSKKDWLIFIEKVMYFFDISVDENLLKF